MKKTILRAFDSDDQRDVFIEFNSKEEAIEFLKGRSYLLWVELIEVD